MNNVMNTESHSSVYQYDHARINEMSPPPQSRLVLWASPSYSKRERGSGEQSYIPLSPWSAHDTY